MAKSWQTSAVRQILCSGRIAGLREHHGQVIGPAVWPAIITPAERDSVLARIAACSAPCISSGFGCSRLPIFGKLWSNQVLVALNGETGRRGVDLLAHGIFDFAKAVRRQRIKRFVALVNVGQC